MVSVVLASLVAAAAPNQPKTPIQVCVETCVALAHQPGYELQQCIAQCNSHARLSTEVETPENCDQL